MVTAFEAWTPEKVRTTLIGLHEFDKQVDQATHAGIAAAGRTLTVEEGYVVEDFVTCALDGDRPAGQPLSEAELAIISSTARSVAEDGLLVKALMAVAMEHTLTEKFSVMDGPVGRALDEAISVLRPLAHGWTQRFQS